MPCNFFNSTKFSLLWWGYPPCSNFHAVLTQIRQSVLNKILSQGLMNLLIFIPTFLSQVTVDFTHPNMVTESVQILTPCSLYLNTTLMRLQSSFFLYFNIIYFQNNIQCHTTCIAPYNFFHWFRHIPGSFHTLLPFFIYHQNCLFTHLIFPAHTIGSPLNKPAHSSVPFSNRSCFINLLYFKNNIFLLNFIFHSRDLIKKNAY